MLRNGHVLLDTCVVNNLLSKEQGLASRTEDLLRDLSLLKNKFYISHFTKYELLRSATGKKRAKCEELLNWLLKIEMTDTRLDRAIHLYSLYKKHNGIKNHLESISDIDIFIGSLIFTKQDTYLLTADYCDFPRPFFLEECIWPVEYERKKGGKSCIYYYLLKANLSEF